MKKIQCTFSPHIAIQVKDRPEAVTFLRDKLGFHIHAEKQDETELSLSDIRFYVEESPEQQTFFEIQTSNLQALVEELRKSGCRLNETKIPEGDTSYLVYTPFGFNFHIWETREKPDPVNTLIRVAVDLHCSPEAAFSFFTEADKLTQWLTQKAEIDPRVGGKYELFWTPGDPDPENNSTYGCSILAIDRPHFLHFNWKGNAEQKHFMNHVQPLTQVSVIFSAISNGCTRVNLVHSGWRNGGAWESARQYFNKAWTGAFKQLEKIVNHT